MQIPRPRALCKLRPICLRTRVPNDEREIAGDYLRNRVGIQVFAFGCFACLAVPVVSVMT